MNPDNTDNANSANPSQTGGAAPADNSAPSLEDAAAELTAAATTGNLNGENPVTPPASPAPADESSSDGLDLADSDDTKSTDSEDADKTDADAAEDPAAAQPLVPSKPLPGSIGSVKSGPALPDTDLPAAAAAATPAADPAVNDLGMSNSIQKPVVSAPEPTPAPASAEPAPTPEPVVAPEPPAAPAEPTAPSAPEPTPTPETPAEEPIAPESTPTPETPAEEPIAPESTPTPETPAEPIAPEPTPASEPTAPAPASAPVAPPAQSQPIKLPRAKGKFPLIPVLIAVFAVIVIVIIVFVIVQSSQNNSQPEVTNNTSTEVIVQHTALSCTSEETDLGDGITAAAQEYIANYTDEDLQDISSISTITYEDEDTATNALTVLKENYNSYVSETLALSEDPFDSSFILDEDDPLTVIMTQSATADLLDTTTGRYFNMVTGIEDEDEDTESTSDETTTGTIAEPDDDTESTEEEISEEDEETVSSPTLVTSQSDLKKLYESLGFTCQVTDTASEQEN